MAQYFLEGARQKMRMIQYYCMQDLEEEYEVYGGGLRHRILRATEQQLPKMWYYIEKFCEQQLPPESRTIYNNYYERYLATKFTLHI